MEFKISDCVVATTEAEEAAASCDILQKIGSFRPGIFVYQFFTSQHFLPTTKQLSDSWLLYHLGVVRPNDLSVPLESSKHGPERSMPDNGLTRPTLLYVPWNRNLT